MIMKKRIFLSIAAVVIAVVMAAPGFCQIKPGSFTFSPFIGGHTFEGNMDLDTGPTYGVRLGYDFTKHFGAELSFDFVDTKYTEPANSIGTNVWNYRLEGLYHFMPENRLVPFISLGAGGQNLDFKDAATKNKSRFAADYGVGLKYFLTEAIALRADVKHLLAFDSVYNELVYTLGLSIPFGAQKAVPAAAPAAFVAETKQAEAAPAVEKVEAAPVIPKEVEPAPIVIQEDEKKMKAAAAEAVAKEIIEKGRATINVEFDFDKADVKSRYYDEIKKFADVMAKYKDLKVVIEGHTDNIGTEAYNQDLSMRRADSVKNCLIKKFGTEETRLTSKGYGFSKPIADNKTAAGRQKNRRVEAAVDYIIKK